MECKHDKIKNLETGLKKQCANCGEPEIYKCPDCGVWVDKNGELHGYPHCNPEPVKVITGVNDTITVDVEKLSYVIDGLLVMLDATCGYESLPDDQWKQVKHELKAEIDSLISMHRKWRAYIVERNYSKKFKNSVHLAITDNIALGHVEAIMTDGTRVTMQNLEEKLSALLDDMNSGGNVVCELTKDGVKSVEQKITLFR
jgi:hypothetical protein